jgi:hypothetical protein
LISVATPQAVHALKKFRRFVDGEFNALQPVDLYRRILLVHRMALWSFESPNSFANDKFQVALTC